MTSRAILQQGHNKVLEGLRNSLEGMVELQKAQTHMLQKRVQEKAKRRAGTANKICGLATIKLLVVSKTPGLMQTCMTLSQINGTKFEISSAQDATKAAKLAQDADIVVVACPPGSCEEVMSLVRQVRTPVIVVSESHDHNCDQKALEAGAADFLGGEAASPRSLEKSIRYCLKKSC